MKRIILTALPLILFLLLLVGVTARLGWWPVSATAVPPQWESKFGQALLQVSLSDQAAGLKNPIRPSNDVLIAGLKIFQDELRWLPRITRSTEPMGDSKFLSVFINSRIIRLIYRHPTCF